MDEKPRKTLTDFIDQNQKLLSTIGVFTALSVFINQLPGDLAKSDAELHVVLRLLSSLLCVLAIIAFIEVLKNSFTYPEQGLIRLFNTVLLLAFAMFVFVWVKTFLAGAVVALIFLLGITLLVTSLTLFAMLIQTIMKHTSLLKSRSQRTREYFIPLFGSLILTVTAIAVLHRCYH
jgi:hypothetical protein